MISTSANSWRSGAVGSRRIRIRWGSTGQVRWRLPSAVCRGYGWTSCWRERRIMLHEAGRQVRPDGVYFEQSLYYHVYALDFFLYARLLAARNGMEIPPEY